MRLPRCLSCLFSSKKVQVSPYEPRESMDVIDSIPPLPQTDAAKEVVIAGSLAPKSQLGSSDAVVGRTDGPDTKPTTKDMRPHSIADRKPSEVSSSFSLSASVPRQDMFSSNAGAPPKLIPLATTSLPIVEEGISPPQGSTKSHTF